MVLSWFLLILTAGSLLCGILTGSGETLGTAMLEGASQAVELTLSLAGPLCLWSGLQYAMEESGISGIVAKLFSPLLRFLFPQSSKDMEACAAISQNLSANLLGLGNAATPMGIRAIGRMQSLSGGETATREMCRLVVLNTASLQLLPTTIAAARAGMGCAKPYAILPAVWLSSLLSIFVGLIAAKLMEPKT